MKKVIKISNAENSFAMFLIAMNVRFAYSYGDFYITDTTNIEKFSNWCTQNGVRDVELTKMTFEVVDFENEF